MQVSAARQNTANVQVSTDWREEMLAQLRAIIHQADSAIVEERKWKKPSNPEGVPVFSNKGIVCTGETYKNAVKLTFARAPSSMTRRASSTPAWKAICAAPSTFAKAIRSMRRLSKP